MANALVILFLAGVAAGCLAFYFIPSAIAIFRNHRNAASIILLNLFFGWSGLGWVIALIWAVSYQEPEVRAR